MNVFTFRRRSSLRSWVTGSSRRGLKVSQRLHSTDAGFELLEGRVLLSAVSLSDRATATTALITPPDTDYPVAISPGGVSTAGVSGAPPFPLADTFALHSLPGADLVIYLDFDGHVTSGTAWNTQFTGGADIISPAFDVDGNPNIFSAIEREYIQRVWQRVSEDFAPFNVDVTTQDPGIEALRKSGVGDTKWGVRSIQTTDFGTGAGGIAFLGSFSWTSDTPVFTFNGSTGVDLFNESVAADTHSHEVGHSLGLSHDGWFSQGYYGGHGIGPTSWAPIMGAGFGQNVSQWSIGEYPGANNQEDDLEIITNPALNGAGWGYSGLTYRSDDFGGTIATATVLTQGTSIWGPTYTGSGLIERNTDADMFSFTWIGGAFSITVDPFERGANLDILAEIYNSSGVLVASSNPFSSLSATINAFLNAGTYFLKIDGIGKAPNGTDYGYSDYGSLGWYTISTPPPFEDRYEENDVRGLATDPLNNGGNWEGMWLSDINLPGRAQDEDWFIINVKPGQLRVRAELDFVDADGDLDLWLVDANGIPVAKSESVTDDEFIDVVVSAPGTYYLRVLPYANEVGNFYNLRWFDDVPISTVSVAVSPAGTAENGTSNIAFTFTRVLDISKAVTVNFSVSGTALFQSDYSVSGAKTFTVTTGSVTFAAGSSTAIVVIDPTADTVVELDESIVLTLIAGPGYELGLNTSATSIIRNDDQARVSIDDVSVVEGNSGTTQLIFTLTLDNAVDSGFSVFFNSADQNPVSAMSGTDYASVSGSVMFTGTAGEMRTITIMVNGDTDIELDETFDLVLAGILTNGRNIIRDRNRATGTIINDDAPPAAPTNVQASDNRSDFVAVTWNAVAGADNYSIYRGAVNDIAMASQIASGVVGTSYNDVTATPGITYFYWVKSVNMIGSTASTSDTGTVVHTVTISVPPPSINEDAAGTILFTFTRNGSTANALTINVFFEGTARFDDDYTQTGAADPGVVKTVTFAAGSATAIVAIDPTADTNYELNETVVLRIKSEAGYALGAKTAAVTTIINDDAKPRLGLVTSPGPGYKPQVLVYDSTGQTVRLTINAYSDAFTRGVRVAIGDVNNDGVSDVVVAPMSGIAPIKVLSGVDQTILRSFLAYSDSFNDDLNASFAGGFTLAVGDVDGDQFADIIVAPASGAGPFVRVFSGKTGAILSTFKVLDNENFKGGLNIAAGDTNNDGKVELFVTPISGIGPFVRIYNPLDGILTQAKAFWAFTNTAYTGGLTVAAGDVNGDGKAEVITGLASGGPVVRVFNAATGGRLSDFAGFEPGDSQFSSGVNVGVSDLNGDGKAEIVVTSRVQQSAIRVFNGMTGSLVASRPAPYPTFAGGVFATGEVVSPLLPAAFAASPTSATRSAPLGLSSSATSESVPLPSPAPVVVSSLELDELFADERHLDVLLTA